MADLAVPFDQRIRITALRASLVPAVMLLAFTRSAWADTHWLFEVFEVLGVFLVIAGVLGRFWSILYIGGRKNREVLSDGPYSMCRHPLYFFSTLGVVGFGLMLGSLVTTAILGSLVFAILSATARREEAFLRAEFGPAYEAYAARVPRILPRPSLYRSPAQVTFDVAVLRRNLRDALVFLALIPLAELMEAVHESAAIPHLLIP